MHVVAAHQRPIATVGDVDPMLGGGKGRLVVFDHQGARKAGEDSPAAVVMTVAIADGDAGRVGVRFALHRDAGARGVARLEAVDHDVINVTYPDVVAVAVCGPGRRYHDSGLSEKADRVLCRTGVAGPEATVRTGEDDDVIARSGDIAGLLQGQPRCRLRAGVHVAATGRDVIRRGAGTEGSNHE